MIGHAGISYLARRRSLSTAKDEMHMQYNIYSVMIHMGILCGTILWLVQWYLPLGRLHAFLVDYTSVCIV